MDSIISFGFMKNQQNGSRAYHNAGKLEYSKHLHRYAMQAAGLLYQ